MSDYTAPDFKTWGKHLLGEVQFIISTEGWKGVYHLLAYALKVAYDQGFSRGRLEGEEKGWKDAVDTYYQASTEQWEVASLTDLQEFLNAEEKGEK